MTAIETFRAKVPGIAAKLMGDFPIGMIDAAAVLGNLGHECNGFTILQEISPTVKGSRGGYGWPMWTGPRRRAYEAYCRRNKLDPASDKANYAWLFLELKGSEAGAIGKLKAAPDLNAKVVAFERAYLRSGVPHYPSRRSWAREAADVLPANLPAKAPMPAAERAVILNDAIKEIDRKHDAALVRGTSVAAAGGLGTIGGTVVVASKQEPSSVPAATTGAGATVLGLGLVFIVVAVAAFVVASRHRATAARLRAARIGA